MFVNRLKVDLINFKNKVCCIVSVVSLFSNARADQNTGGALLEFLIRTARHGKSRVSSAISVCDN